MIVINDSVLGNVILSLMFTLFWFFTLIFMIQLELSAF